MAVRSIRIVRGALILSWTASATASETITYRYDAKGRLVQVMHSGTVNNGVQSTYSHDKANNRRKVKVAGGIS